MGGGGGPESSRIPSEALKPCDSPEVDNGLWKAHAPQRTEWTRHHVTLEVSPSQFHITLAVGSTAPSNKELAKSVFHRDPSGRPDGRLICRRFTHMNAR